MVLIGKIGWLKNILLNDYFFCNYEMDMYNLIYILINYVMCR